MMGIAAMHGMEVCFKLKSSLGFSLRFILVKVIEDEALEALLK